MTTVLLVGSGAREHAIAEALAISNGKPKIAAFMASANPGIRKISTFSEIGKITDVVEIAKFAQKVGADIAVIGPETPLAAGVVDKLENYGIPSVGPHKQGAQLESSKSFTRELMQKHGVPGLPAFKVFETEQGIEQYMRQLGSSVVKPDGLTGGKGVLVQGDHFKDSAEGALLARQLIRHGERVVIEEKLEGEEFSLQSITDGKRLIDCPVVQDHKRAFENDLGPNTGGMGSYSDANHLLPFLTAEDVESAHEITKAMLKALESGLKTRYRGIMYGGFIATKNGVRLIEYNARFGDPEAMNVLPLLESDMLEMCHRIVDGTLRSAQFSNKATVCKYLVPRGYPISPEPGSISIGAMERGIRIMYAAVDQKEDGLYLTSSRAIAVVGIADTIADAEALVERNIGKVQGPLFYRKDIGTTSLIQKRIAHMKRVRENA